MTNYTRIVIRDLELTMPIGVSDEERALPQAVLVNIEADVVPPVKPEADDFNQVVCYATIAKAIREMAQSPVKLVETFAEQIAAHILSLDRVTGVRVRIEKTAILPDAVVGIDIYRS